MSGGKIKHAKYERSKVFTTKSSSPRGNSTSTPQRVINKRQVGVGEKDVAHNARRAKGFAEDSRKPAKTSTQRKKRLNRAKDSVRHMTAAAEGRARKKAKRGKN